MTEYDAIVVGARCAGAPTAMLLAQRGYRVLLVDRAEFPSDTVSTHVVQAPAVAALHRWGLLGQVAASGLPPMETYSFDFGPITIKGTPRPAPDGPPHAYAPRRTVLDKILIDGAAKAGAEVRERFSVEEVLVEDGAVIGIRGRDHGGGSVVERARVVVGADGRNSLVAKSVRAARYHEKPKLQSGYYTYYSGLPTDGFEIFIRPSRGWGVAPTNGGLTMVVVGWPHAELEAFKSDPEANLLSTFDLAPEFAERVRAATREERLTGASVPNFFRKPYGPGWVLVGDAGYNKDPITAQGINDAFRDAESVSAALDQAFRGEHSFDDALSSHQVARDTHVLPIYEFTAQLATLAPPTPEEQQVFAAICGNQSAMDDFVSINAGTVSPAEFFSPANIGRLMASAGT
jgi:2-polyprenyl-6-methoxyphenol hydroxylase-like FAD-dependent oxidoreductase